MNKKLLTGLCAVMMLVGLTGCKPKETKPEDPTNTSTTEPKETPKTENTNNKEVTADNFKNFPETDEKYFTYEEWQEGYAIYSCTSDDKVVRVPKTIKGKPVIAIGQRGMANLEKCEAIVLPDTVRYLGESAFAIDEALKYIDLGTGVETVDDNIFNTCTSLEKVEFPEGTQKIGLMVFANNDSIKTIKIPASVTEIDPVFFSRATSNTDVEIHTPKDSAAEKVAIKAGLKVVND